jgi:hypothetical protein
VLIGLLALFLAGEVGIVTGLLGALLVVLFGFLFVTVSARLTGEIGSSSNPISGMTTATLMVTCLIFLALGMTSSVDRVLALSVAAVVCIASSNGGTVAQSLKTGYLVGGTPRLMQYAIIIGALASALVIGATLIYGLNAPGTVYSAKPENVPPLTLTPDELSRLSQSETYEGKAYRVFDTRNDELVKESGSYKPREEVVKYKAGRYLVEPDTGKVAFLKDDTIMGQLRQRDDGTPVERKFDAPKTQVLGIVINGVLKRDLNWTMVAIGAMIAVMLELCGVSALAFAVGLYVPIQYSTPIFIGGLVRWWVDKKFAAEGQAAIEAAGDDPEAKARAEVDAIRKSETSPGVLLASGYIAGGSLAGVLIAMTFLSTDLPRDLSTFQYRPVAIGNVKYETSDPVQVLAKETAGVAALGGPAVFGVEEFPPASDEHKKQALLGPAAAAVAERELPGGSADDRKKLAAQIVALNADDVPFMWVDVPAGTTLKLPGGQSQEVTDAMPLGAIARDRLGRSWKAGQLYDMNKGVLKLPEALPPNAELNLPQPIWPTLIPFGLLVAFLLFVGTGRLLKGPPDEGTPVGTRLE